MERNGITINVNLDDLCKKAVRKGPGYVLAETFLSLMMMAHDTFKQREESKVKHAPEPKKKA